MPKVQRFRRLYSVGLKVRIQYKSYILDTRTEYTVHMHAYTRTSYVIIVIRNIIVIVIIKFVLIVIIMIGI